MSKLEFEVTELHRRLANVIRLGRVMECNYQEVIPRVRVRIGEIETAWLPVLSARAGGDRSWWPLSVNEQVVVLSLSGDLAQGIVLGALSQRAFPAAGNEGHVHRVVYGDGAVIEYDKETHALKAQLPAGGTAELHADGGIKVVGDLNVSGNIVASGDVSDRVRSMQADRDIYNPHTHAGVMSGPASTSPPSAQQ